MGCDIHLLVQIGVLKDVWRTEQMDETIYSGRNYELFAVLANVRNYYNIKPIAMPRGLPKDLKERDKEALEDIYFGGAHSFSYHTLKDIEGYDWEQIVTLSGTIDLRTYRKWMKQGKNDYPEKYSQGVSGPLVMHISNHDMENIINSTEDEGEEISTTLFKCKKWEKRKSIDFYTRVRWQAKYKDVCYIFYNFMIPALQKLSDQYGGPENVRIVFSFDN